MALIWNVFFVTNWRVGGEWLFDFKKSKIFSEFLILKGCLSKVVNNPSINGSFFLRFLRFDFALNWAQQVSADRLDCRLFLIDSPQCLAPVVHEDSSSSLYKVSDLKRNASHLQFITAEQIWCCLFKFFFCLLDFHGGLAHLNVSSSQGSRF